MTLNLRLLQSSGIFCFFFPDVCTTLKKTVFQSLHKLNPQRRRSSGATGFAGVTWKQQDQDLVARRRQRLRLETNEKPFFGGVFEGPGRRTKAPFGGVGGFKLTEFSEK